MTPAQLVASLHSHREITVHSNAALIAELALKQQARAAQGFIGGKPPTAVARFDPPTAHHLSPAELLLCVGLATTPLVALPVALSSQWAYYRYMWAFAPAGPRLRLEASVKDIDFHQKTVLSDELGVGMTHWIMTALLGARSHVDVQAAVKATALAQQQGFPVATLATNRSPDLLYRFDRGRFAVVECKGSQSNHNQTLKQLTSGLEQVPSLRINNARLAEEYVVAARYGLHRTDVYIVDPPGDETDPDAPRPDPQEPAANEETNNPKTLSAPDAEALQADVDRLYAATLLAFAGDAQSAAVLAGLDDERVPETTDPERRGPEPETILIRDEPTGLELYGRQATFPVRGAVEGVRRVDLFQGVASDALPDLRQGNVPAEQEDQRAELFGDTDDRYVVRARPEAGEVTAVSRDGAALRIRLS